MPPPFFSTTNEETDYSALLFLFSLFHFVVLDVQHEESGSFPSMTKGRALSFFLLIDDQTVTVPRSFRPILPSSGYSVRPPFLSSFPNDELDVLVRGFLGPFFLFQIQRIKHWGFFSPIDLSVTRPPRLPSFPLPLRATKMLFDKLLPFSGAFSLFPPPQVW